MFAPHKPMTLRRFVRVTYDNFRQLIQAYATPVGTLRMASTQLPTSPVSADGADGNRAKRPDRVAVQPEEPAAEARPGAPEEIVSAADEQEEIGVTAQVEMTMETPCDEIGVASVELPDVVHADSPVDTFETRDEVEPALATDATGEIEKHAPEKTAQEKTAVDDDAPLPLVPPLAPSELALGAALESLLFVAEEPLEPAYVARVFALDATEVEAALQELDREYREKRRGLRIQVRNGRYQMVTAPEAAGLIETFLNLDTSSKLSGPALETLAVVAYRQPVTRAQIEAVRGVDCSGVLRSLIQRGLIEEVGRMDGPGRPVLYGVSDLFMRHFGLTGLHELPPLANEEDSRIDEIISVDENPPPV